MGYDLSELPARYRKQAERILENAECKMQDDNPSGSSSHLPLHKGGLRTEPYESEEQEALFSWALLMETKYPCLKLLYHVPNGGMRSAAVAGKLKAEGVKAGVPDICLPVARGKYHGLYIELKAGKNKATKDQKEWLSALSEEGYMAILCRGWENASKSILAYLESGGVEEYAEDV